MKFQRSMVLIGLSAAILGTATAGENTRGSVPAGQGGTVTFSVPIASEKTVALYPGKAIMPRVETREAFAAEAFSVGNAGFVSVFTRR